MNESTLVPRQEMSNLDWLARNVYVWPDSGNDMIAGFIPGSQYYGPSCSEIVWCKGGITKRQWLARRAELQNKPSFADHPDAKCFVQNHEGTWYKNTKSDNVSTANGGEWRNNCMNGGWEMLGTGDILGDWRDTLEKRPNANEMPAHINQPKPSAEIHECAEVKQFDPFVSVEDAATAKMPAITPSKYTKTIRGVSVDVYDVLQAWGVSNPALQHLIKKALQCGQRGHKDNAQDLQDIIDSAIRAKELEL